MAEDAAFSRHGFKGGCKPSTISAGLAIGATSFTGADLATWAGLTTNGKTWIEVSYDTTTPEVVQATSVSGNNVTSITRGLRGTTERDHDPNCKIRVVHTDRDFDEANKLVNAVLGISGLVEGDLLEFTSATALRRVAKGSLGQLLGMKDDLTGHQHVSTPPLLSWKQPVRVATTANGTLATAYENGDTVDGVVLATGDRILLKDQTTGSENGVYVVAASGAPTRATDFDASAKAVSGSMVAVQEGTANANKVFQMTTNAPIVLGTTSQTWTEFGGTGVTGTRHVSAQRTSGNITANSTSFADVDTGIDLTLTGVTVGDIIEVGMSGQWGSGAVDAYLDVASVVAAAPVNYWSGGAAGGVIAWLGVSTVTNPFGGTITKAVVSGDLSAGTLTLRLRYATATATNRNLLAASTSPLRFFAKNLGQP